MLRGALAVAITVAWAGCSGGGGGGVADDITLTLTTDGGATTLQAGQSLGIQAHLANATNPSVTWSLAGPACPAACGTLSPSGLDATYAAPSSVATNMLVRVEATSVQDASKKGSVQLTVLPRSCPAHGDLLRGQYAFLVQGFHLATAEGIAAIGSFTADGCGLVTGGNAEVYFGTGLGLSGSTELTGSYTVGADRRGTLTLGEGPSAVHFAMALGVVSGGVATKGALAVSDAGTAPVLSGAMYRQDAGAFSLGALAGSWAFVLNGWNGHGPREALGSTLMADTAGGLFGGVLDDVVFGVPAPGAPVPATIASWTGTFGAPDASGRSAIHAPALGGANGDAVAYVVTSTHALLLAYDTSAAAGAGRVVSGRMLRQAGPFDANSLSGTAVAFQAANYHQPGFEGMNMATLSIFEADGAGNLTGIELDQNAGGNQYHLAGVAYTYTVASDGQATIWSAPSIPGGKWYLLARNTGLMLGFDVGVSIGQILPQADGPFSASSVDGDYLLSQAPGGTQASVNGAGVATSSGNGMLETVVDVSQAGVFTAGLETNVTLSVEVSGRALGSDGYVYYVVSPTRLLRMIEGTYDWTTFYPVIEQFDR
jgi:hypothetical protein